MRNISVLLALFIAVIERNKLFCHVTSNQSGKVYCIANYCYVSKTLRNQVEFSQLIFLSGFGEYHDRDTV